MTTAKSFDVQAFDTMLKLEAEYKSTSAALKEISVGGPFGLTPDSVRSTEQWKSAKSAFEQAFAALRLHNQIHARR